MSKRSIDRAGWAPRERDEYGSLLAEVVAYSSGTTQRLDRFEQLLNDAEQAQRPWASEVARACRREGLGAEIRRYQDRNRAMVSYDGEVLNLPAVQSRKVNVGGRLEDQRELIELWSWEEIAAKRADAIRSQQTYTNKVAHYDRLLALRELCPSSRTPAEAAMKVGIHLDDFLAGEAAA